MDLVRGELGAAGLIPIPGIHEGGVLVRQHDESQSIERGQGAPAGVTPPQVRGALTAVIRRTLEAPGTFDAGGWLTIGFCGHQPGVGESYISTGSLYLSSLALLPLGLPATDEFWSAPPQPWTSQLAWSGQPFPIDRALAT